MKALILRDDAEASVACAQALMKKGFQVICVETRHIARALLRIETIDLLVMDERVDGRLTHSVALSAERRLPYISAILMTDRPAPDADDLYDLIPSLYSLMGTATSPALLAQLAMSSMESYEEARARVDRITAADDETVLIGADSDWDEAEIAEQAREAEQDEVPMFVDEFVMDEVADIPSYAAAVSATPEFAETDEDQFEEDEHVAIASRDLGDGMRHLPVTHIPQVGAISELRKTAVS